MAESRTLRSAALVAAASVALAAVATHAGARFSDTPTVGANAVSTDTLEPPTDLVLGQGPGVVELGWTATPDLYAEGHVVLRSSSLTGPFTPVAQVTPRALVKYTDTPPTAGTWYYVIRAYYENWQSVDSAMASTTPGPPEDYDAIPAAADNCPITFNIDQFDTDGDGTGDRCDDSPTLPTTGTFSANGQNQLTGDAEGLSLGDLDGDGDLDALYADWAAANSVWLNDGAGVLTDTGQTLSPGSQSTDSALGDLDGDGDLDAVYTANSTPTTVWRNDGTGVLSFVADLSTADTRNVALGDVDGDGDLDLVLATTDAPNTVWLNDGSGGFTDSGQALGAANGRSVALGDLDGDADLDVFIRNTSSQPDTVWLNDGTGTFTDSGQAIGTSGGGDVALADLDGDGDLDAVVTAGSYVPNEVWLNDGSGTFTDSGQAHGADRTPGLALGDLDGDGDIDIAYGNQPTDPDQVWLNDGSAAFTDSGQSLATTGWSAAAGDMDGDGDLDLVFTERNTVWLNS